ncbi:MAG: valine--tRNA ligase [Omnitrophica bacterium GWA2_41_15]|nr:MAG: valine--tRNA ligase [Omnitrophica bacterium GWA2_41_15]HAZ10937.1 valine--tRNA ligase [Candidatus Omnitrophota bacterium]
MKDIPPRYNPKDHEESIYSKWENSRLFHAEPDPSKKPFTITIPPPNVTGILHMGHALNNTLQDILIRWKRMQGSASLWVPGTDHAGIATQNVVERNLREKGITRQGLGREKFVEEVWKWREKYGNTIIMQLKRLGASCDWERTRFTMDKGLSEAVLEAFVQLYNKGLIYRGNYIINWCPRCQTALSDEEAPHQDVEGKLYYILYSFKEGKGVVVATTRPETMLGDVAVAVNPKDRRYKKLMGKKLILPIVGKEINIIADDFVDKKFGTGAVKVTPAHDPNDFEMAKRHNLEPITVMGPDGRMNENAGRFNGLDRFEARKLIVAELEEKKLLIKTEKHDHAVGHCYRCHTVIEPYLSLQWFVRMKPLAEPAIEAVRSGKIKFHPKRWTKVYLNWMENIKDWCISRQIWWGHRLPVYYCQKCNAVIVSKVTPEKCQKCGSVELKQDEDVLDTWFSSWLWPFSTLGWPEKTKDMEYFYPTSVLVTAPEILFFWVARMIMSGKEFIKEIPFSDVYIHGTVRDATGKKMSKSLGNIIDPLEIIDGFGADALRFSIISITSAGQDVFLSKEKFEIGRNFANKIWNASRFVLMNIEQRAERVEHRAEEKLSIADRWILSRLNRTIEAVTRALKNYRFNEAESLLYDFFWHDFCDWYVEMVKPQIIGQSAESKEQRTGEILIHVLENSLKLLHPFMPFVTEAIWQSIRERDSIMIAAWPEADKHYINKKIESDIEIVKNIIVNIRNIRSDMNIAYSKKLTVGLAPLKQGAGSVVSNNAEYIKNLAHLEKLTIDENFIRPKSSLSAVTEEFNIFIPLEGVIDVEAEKARLVKKQDLLKQQIVFTEKKLKDKNFMDHAPESVVRAEQEKAEKLREQIDRLGKTIEDL